MAVREMRKRPGENLAVFRRGMYDGGTPAADSPRSPPRGKPDAARPESFLAGMQSLTRAVR